MPGSCKQFPPRRLAAVALATLISAGGCGSSTQTPPSKPAKEAWQERLETLRRAEERYRACYRHLEDAARGQNSDGAQSSAEKAARALARLSSSELYDVPIETSRLEALEDSAFIRSIAFGWRKGRIEVFDAPVRDVNSAEAECREMLRLLVCVVNGLANENYTNVQAKAVDAIGEVGGLLAIPLLVDQLSLDAPGEQSEVGPFYFSHFPCGTAIVDMGPTAVAPFLQAIGEREAPLGDLESLIACEVLERLFARSREKTLEAVAPSQAASDPYGNLQRLQVYLEQNRDGAVRRIFRKRPRFPVR